MGSAFAAIVRGPKVRKACWLLGGIVVLWIINLGRITFIFYAGQQWGEPVAINVFHPFVGLVTFSLGVLLMILLIKPLGMQVAPRGEGSDSKPRGTSAYPSTIIIWRSANGDQAQSPVGSAKSVRGSSGSGGCRPRRGSEQSESRAYNLVAGVTGEASCSPTWPIPRLRMAGRPDTTPPMVGRNHFLATHRLESLHHARRRTRSASDQRSSRGRRHQYAGPL